MITASNLGPGHANRAAGGFKRQHRFPRNPSCFAETTDTDRNVRYTAFDNAIFNTRLRGNYTVERLDAFTNGSLNVSVPANILKAIRVEIRSLALPPIVFVPGAMADNLTSFGGQIFENSGQTPILSFLAAGAAGSYGTVVEPCNYTQKFPDPQNYFYQARGFSLAECYYQSVTNPYEGLVMGEPLASPFAQPAAGAWNGLSSNAVLTGTTNLSLSFTASDAQNPVQQIDLFLDGNWFQTVTNIAPSPGDVLDVTLNGFTTNYTVPPGATVASVTSNLTDVLNNAVYQNPTEVLAILHGDRIELQSTNGAKTGAQIPVVAGSSASVGAPTTFVHASRASFLDSIAAGLKSYEITGTTSATSYELLTVTKTNGAMITVAVTNASNGNLTQLTQQLLALISATPALETPDGLVGDDLQTDPSTGDAFFKLVALEQGYAAAQIQADLTVSPDLAEIQNSGETLTDNLSDLVPRNHLYVTAGATNLSLSFPFNTATLADGYHELTAVAYEGSHVRTQARAGLQAGCDKNTTLTATFATLVGGTNAALEATLQFAVTASASNINTISTYSVPGALLAAATNQSWLPLSVPGDKSWASVCIRFMPW